MAYHQISGERLEQHIQYLKKFYHLISFDQFIKHLLLEDLPPHSVCLTFDDGYRTVFTENLPVLRKYKTSAIVYLVVDLLKGVPVAWWEELRFALLATEKKVIWFNQKKYRLKNQAQRGKVYQKLIYRLKSLPHPQKVAEVKALLDQVQIESGQSKSMFMNLDEVCTCMEQGMEVGSHTISHPILSEINSRDWPREIKDSKSELERILNCPIKHFSYPNGTARDFNAEIVEIVQQAGYQSAVSLIPGGNGGSADFFKLKRIEVGDENSVPVLATKLAGLFW